MCAMLLASCSKEEDMQAPAPQSQSAAGQVLNVTINTGQPYSVAYEKATELNIHKQATHFKESTTTVNNETGQVVYRYVPSEGFKGADEVVLSTVKMVTENTSGCYRGNYGSQQNVTLVKTYTTVKINVQ